MFFSLSSWFSDHTLREIARPELVLHPKGRSSPLPLQISFPESVIRALHVKCLVNCHSYWGKDVIVPFLHRSSSSPRASFTRCGGIVSGLAEVGKTAPAGDRLRSAAPLRHPGGGERCFPERGRSARPTRIWTSRVGGHTPCRMKRKGIVHSRQWWMQGEGDLG